MNYGMENRAGICYSLVTAGNKTWSTGRGVVEAEQALKRAELFLGLDNADILRIAALPSTQVVAFSSGEVMFTSGARANRLFVLRKGQVDLVMKVPQGYRQGEDSVVVDRITTGGCFGWSALVRPHRYVMSAVCHESSELVAINGVELMALFEQDYRIGYRTLQTLSHLIGARLRDTEQALVTGQRWPFAGR